MINAVKQGKNKLLGGITGNGFMPGKSGNPKGRPKEKTLKEFCRGYLQSMTENERINFLNSVKPEFVWRMAEGNPHQSKDITMHESKSIGQILNDFGD